MNFLKKLLPVIMAAIWIFSGRAVINSVLAGDNTLVIERFLAQVGNSWEYRRTFYTIVYDSVHNDTTEYLIIDSLHSEFQAIDSIRGWKCYRYNLILFQATDTFYQTRWYAHPDTALLKIASSGQPIVGPPRQGIAKTILKLGDKYFNSPNELKQYLFQLRNYKFLTSEPDTNFWDPPLKLLIYPLAGGSSWISMRKPWLEERQVIEEIFTTVPKGGFLTLKIQIRSDRKDIEWYEWIAEKGIVKDSIHIKGIVLDAHNEEIIGHFSAYDKYELLDYTTSPADSVVWVNIQPNPFCPTTSISFRIGSTTHITIKVYNAQGKLVRILMDEEKLPGNYNISWDEKDISSREVAGGIYFYHIKTKDYSATKKIVLLR